MALHIQQSVLVPRRKGMTTEELWKGEDKGIIASWECGRDLADKRPELAEAASRGELPILPWKGGVEAAIKSGLKYGTLRYLAMWQGLRRQDLDVPMEKETQQTCARTGVVVTFTSDASKYAAP